MALSPTEKTEVIDVLLQSLDHPDKLIDRLWKVEAKERIDAYKEGKISTISVEEAISKYQSRES